MKNMEINKKLGFKVVAVLTSASMVLGGLAGCGKNTTQDTTAIEQTSEAEESDDLLTNVMNQVVHHSSTAGTELQKDEVVYVMADAQGNTQKIIVSDCLKNANGDSTIKDASSLSDIVNVKGDESYTVDADGNLVWNANGSDIYYQGTTDKELPVDVSISYELEGEEISPEDLVGKTGNVTIRFTYTNNEKTTVEVNGKEKEVYVPFAMISGALLPAEHFSDIEVTNGKVISEGDNNVVVGIAFPGLKDSINIDSLKDKAIDDEAKEKLDEVEIPETVEIHAYATDFEMNQTMTMAMSDLLSDLNLDDTLDIDTSKITDSMNELKDATQQLKDGSTELNDGMASLQEGAQTLADKSKDLDSGAGELVSGIGTLNEGAASLNSGADELNSGAASLKDGAASLNEGAATLNNGAGSLKDGISQVNSGAESLNSGAASLDSGIKTLQAGTGQLASGASTLDTGAQQLQAGIKKASDAVNAIKGGFETSEENKTPANSANWGLIYASGQAVAGAESLYNGITNLIHAMTAVTEQNTQIQTSLFSMEDQLEGARAAVGDMGDAPSITYSTGSSSSTESSSTNQNSGSSSENSSSTEAANAGSDETQAQEAATASESTNVEATDYSDSAVNDAEVQIQSEDIAVAAVEEESTPAESNESEISVASESNASDENSAAVSDASDTSDSESSDNSNGGNPDTNQNNSSQENASENTDDASGQEESGQEESGQQSSNSSNEESSSVVNVDEIAAYYYELGYKNGQEAAYDEFEEMLSELAAVMDNNPMLCDGTEGQTTGETLIDSLTKLQEGAKNLWQLTKGIDSGINTVYDGLSQLLVGTEEQGSKGGFVALNAGAEQLAAGTAQAKTSISALDTGAQKLASGSSTLLAGTNTLKSGTSQLLTGAQTLKDGTQTLQNGTQTLLNGTQSLKDGTQTLKDGTQTLQDGTLELLKGGQTLKDGTSQFVDGTAELNDGALQLLDGTGELMDGLFKFDEEGISKLTDLFGDNVQDVIDELQAVFDAGRSYKIYSDSASDMDSSVKFIYKTEAVK